MSKMSKTIAILGVVAGLGVAALPLSTYAVDPEPTVWDGTTNAAVDADGNHQVSKDTQIQLKIDDVLSIDTDTDLVDLSTGEHTGAVKVTVITNNSKGYHLAIKGSADENPTSLTNNTPAKEQIVKTSGTFAAPAAFGTSVSEWGYSVAGEAAFTEGLYAGVEATDVDIHTQDTPTDDKGVETDVTFAAKLVPSQAAGTYTGQVTFTATNNANAEAGA